MRDAQPLSIVTNKPAENHIDQRRVLSIPDFASVLSLRSSTIRKWLVQRRLAKVKLGRRTMIPIGEINRLIAEGLVPAKRDEGQAA